ncbi:uncharacterized protein [Atheta coriaria]|uniref:uncharacterized protein n=1 Tax=Dalotia coriaria TaxID=877792 RepID=UPI0031F475D3
MLISTLKSLTKQSTTTPVKPLLQSVTIEEISHETEDVDENNMVETIILPQFPLSPLPECQSCLEDVHCYANIDANALALADCYDPSSGNINGVIGGNFVIDEPQEVNYVELDLEPSGCGPVSVSKTRPLSGDSPVKGKPYVTIDFKKTDALSNSINPRLELEEGCRKTRHNSTIGDIRHSSSISD